jgi:hypothetical protein
VGRHGRDRLENLGRQRDRRRGKRQKKYAEDRQECLQ